nr:LysR family transcriptional regulator [Rhizobium halophytocola]
MIALDALLRDENVTHAAQRLNITQSALSGRLTRLRQVFNDPLFVPASTGRGMTATPHALALKPELERLLESLTRFVQSAQVFDPATSTRTFRIAATDNPAAILAPDLMPLIHAQAPRARIALTLPDKARIGETLAQGDVDLFIGAAEDATPDLIGRTLFKEEFVTAQRIGHPRGTGPLTAEEFARLDHLLISTSGGGFSGVIDDAMGEIGLARRVSVSIQSYALAPLVIASTDCLCTLPRRFLERFTDTLEIYPTPVPLGLFAVKLFWHPKMSGDPAHAWLRGMVMEAARDSRQRRPG